MSLPPSLHDPFGKTVTISIGPKDKVGDILAKLEAQTGVPVSDQLLSVGTGGGTLAPTSSLASAGIVDGSLLTLELTEAPSDPFVIEVTLPPSLHGAYGISLKIATSPTASVGELKAAVAAITGMR